MKKEDRSFYQGFAVAVSTLARTAPSLAVDICVTNGVSREDFIAAGVSEFDMNAAPWPRRPSKKRGK